MFTSFPFESPISNYGAGQQNSIQESGYVPGENDLRARLNNGIAQIDVKVTKETLSCDPDGKIELKFTVEEFTGVSLSIESTTVAYHSLCRSTIYDSIKYDFPDINIDGGRITHTSIQVDIPQDIADLASRNGDDGVLLRIDLACVDENGNSFDHRIFKKIELISKVAVIVDDRIEPTIRDNLDRFYSDIESANAVEFIEVSDLWPDAETIREELVELWETEDITGAILVGDLPFAIWEMIHSDGSIELLPVPIFFEDLDGGFEDNDSDGYYNYHYWGENDGPEIWISFLSPPSETIPSDHLRPSETSTSGGLKGTYFNDNQFGNPVVTRTDPEIEFYWRDRNPPSPVPDDLFSIEWSGQILSEFDELITFELYYGGGVVLYIDDVEVYNHSGSPPWAQRRELIDIEMDPGWHDIRVLYKENGWGDSKGYIRLCWRSSRLVGDMLNKYLDKDHLYHTGEMDYPEEGLLFMDYCYGLQSNMMDPIRLKHLEPLYGEHLDCGGGEATTNATEYLEYLDKGHEITSIWSHAGGKSHQFQVDPDSGAKVTGASSFQIMDTKGSVVTLIWGCHAGDFADSSYWLSSSMTENLVVNYAFNTEYGLAAVGCTRSFGTTFDTVYHDWADGSYLGMGYFHYKDVGYDKDRRMGESHPLGEKMWVEDEVLFGDPFIRIDHYPDDPEVSIENGSRFISGDEVTIEVSSEGAGEMRLFYQGELGKWIPFKKSFTLDIEPTDGILKVSVETRNGYGNCRFAGSDMVYMDNSPPEIIDFKINDGGAHTNDTRVRLHLDVLDEISGLGSMKFSNDGQSWSDWEEYNVSRFWELFDEDGERTVFVMLRDNVGNEVMVKKSIMLDTMGPRIIENILANKGDDGWYISDMDLSFHSLDDDTEIIIFRIDDGSWTEFDQSIILMEDGQYDLSFYGVDHIGNIGPVQNLSIRIDKSPPLINEFSAGGETRTTTDTVILNIDCEDETSGLRSMRFGPDGSNWGEWLDFNSIHHQYIGDQEGVIEVYLQVMDVAGNIRRSTDPIEIIRDVIPPYILGASPEEGEVIETDHEIYLHFSEVMDMDQFEIKVLGPDGNEINLVPEQDQYGKIFLTMDPEPYLVYSIIVDEGSSDLAGNILGRKFELNFSVKGHPPGIPVNLNGMFENESVLLNWGKPIEQGDLPIIGYRIYRTLGLDPWIEVGITSDLSYRDPSVDPGNEYQYRIAAFNEVEEGEVSIEITVIIPGEDPGIDEDENEDKGYSDGSKTLVIIGSLILLLIIGLSSVILLIHLRRKHPREIVSGQNGNEK